MYTCAAARRLSLLFLHSCRNNGRGVSVTKTSQPQLHVAARSCTWLHIFFDVCGVACTTPVCGFCWLELLYPAVPCCAQAQKRFGVVIQVIPETAEGDIDIPALRQMLAQQVSVRVWGLGSWLVMLVVLCKPYTGKVVMLSDRRG